jgi:hypothetical protein
MKAVTILRRDPDRKTTKLAQILIHPTWSPMEYERLQPPKDSAQLVERAPGIIGFRTWMVDADCNFSGATVRDGNVVRPQWQINRIHVRSLYQYALWPGSEVRFHCEEHQKPIEGDRTHQCGLHAYHSIDSALTHQNTFEKCSGIHHLAVTGVVAGYGVVWVHDDGWRAEELHILGLLEQGPHREVRRYLADEFDVPLLDRVGLERLGARHGRVIAKDMVDEMLA